MIHHQILIWTLLLVLAGISPHFHHVTTGKLSAILLTVAVEILCTTDVHKALMGYGFLIGLHLCLELRVGPTKLHSTFLPPAKGRLVSQCSPSLSSVSHLKFQLFCPACFGNEKC